MSKTIHPETIVTIEGQQYSLIFPFSALAKFADLLGIPANEVQTRLDARNIMLSDLTAILWAGLQKKHKTAFSQVEEWIDDMSPAEIKALFEKAQGGMSGAYPQDERIQADRDANEDDAGNEPKVETTPT